MRRLHLIEFPSGRWGFVGHVPGELAFVTKDGKMPTDEQVEALQAAIELGYRAREGQG
jgi:hypothetical protein